MPSISLLIKPASGSCNLRCKYCFYADEMENRTVQSYGMMSIETLENMIKKTFDYAEYNCTIAFQGGEPTLIGLDYYKKVVEFVDKYNVNKLPVNYAIQTNGVVINDEWASFFTKHNFLVGLSLDGTKEIHNEFRIDSKGEGTFDRVMAAAQTLKKHQTQFNILTVVNAKVSKKAKEIYNFYKENNFLYHQFIECLDPLGEKRGKTEFSLRPRAYGKFLCELFDCWYEDMMAGTYVYNRYFENVIMLIKGVRPESCAMSGVCSKQWVIEADGSVYPCDFYVLDRWKLGNLNAQSIDEIEKERDRLAFIKKSQHLPKDCTNCKWLSLCRNGCRRNCEPFKSGQRDTNHFCEGYKEFLDYSVERMIQIMKKWNV